MSSFNMAACLSESGSYVPCQVDSYIVVKKKLVVTFKIIKDWDKKSNQMKLHLQIGFLQSLFEYEGKLTITLLFKVTII